MTPDGVIGSPARGADDTTHVEELSPPLDPAAAFEQIRGLPYPIFLDSASDPARLGRYSFVTADPWAIVSGKDGHTTVLTPRSVSTSDNASRGSANDRTANDQIEHPTYASQMRITDADPLAVVRDLLSECAASPLPDLPPFQSGAAGYIGYDYGRSLERLPAAHFDDLDIPDVLLGLYDWTLSWDHQTGRCWLMARNRPEAYWGPRNHHPSERCSEIRRLLTSVPPSRPTASTLGPPTTPPFPPAAPLNTPAQAPSFPVPGHPNLRSSFTHERYLEVVARVREYILAGDIFQANLSQRLEAPYDDDPWALYRRLRLRNPAAFAAYLEAPGLAVLSASPERFLQITPDGAVETRPIKGTRPRGIGPEHDAHLGRALLESEKDRAENLMIVDLLRNDLSRVCRPGSVRVPELFALEHFSTVHHLVSTVVGQLTPGVDAIDVLRATFPGGSITGAPKVRAMEIIAELEPSRRGVYCGSIGYLSATGAADFSIVIRTFVARNNKVYFSAGGGIVADSEPEAEYLETLDKAQALIAALPMSPGAVTPARSHSVAAQISPQDTIAALVPGAGPS